MRGRRLDPSLLPAGMPGALHPPTRGPAVYPVSRGPGPRRGPQRLPRSCRLVSLRQQLVEETFTAQLDARVVALEAIQDPAGLLERLPAQDEPIEPLEIEAQALLERAQRSQVHVHVALAVAPAGCAQRAAIGHAEGHLAAVRRERCAAAHAGIERGA